MLLNIQTTYSPRQMESQYGCENFLKIEQRFFPHAKKHNPTWAVVQKPKQPEMAPQECTYLTTIRSPSRKFSTFFQVNNIHIHE